MTLDFLSQVDAFDFQKLVAGLLRAMGFQIIRVSPPGPDGGFDINTAPDIFGLESPRIKIQVKNRRSQANGPEIQQLAGVTGATHKLFVSTSGFNTGALREADKHSNLALIEVTSDCNLKCPVCFADSQPGFSLSIYQVESMIERFIELAGNPEVIQFSGGEPTIHPDILPMPRTANEKGIQMVMLNTNGIRIAEDNRFLAALADVRPTIYLQFDGFTEKAHELLRGRNLLPIKLKALDRLAQAKLGVVLVPTIDKNINHDQIGDIVEFGLNHPAVCGVAFQPLTHVGRLGIFDPMNRETIPDVIHGIVEQTDGMLVESDFIPVPCCHPTCCSATYLYIENGKITPLPRVLEVDKYLNYVVNRTLPEIRSVTPAATCLSNGVKNNTLPPITCHVYATRSSTSP